MTLNGLTIPTPIVPMKINPVRIERSERTASGKLVTDIIADKYEYELSYSGLSVASMLIFKTIFSAGAAVTFAYTDSAGAQSKTVYMPSLPYSIHKLNPLLSQNVTIKLEEI